MAKRTNIQWCDSTFNPWIGCTRIGPGCDYCYAAVSTPVRARRIVWGAGNIRERTSEATWSEVERWNRHPWAECHNCQWRGRMIGNCPQCGRSEDMHVARRRVFCASLADWLDNEVPIEWLVDLLDLIRRTPNLDWLLLTKRIGNWQNRVHAAYEMVCKRDATSTGGLAVWLQWWLNGNQPANVWLGITVVNQPEADRDVVKLQQVPARVRFLSIEPMLSAVSLTNLRWTTKNMLSRHDALRTGWVHDSGTTTDLPRLDWIIAGGESGTKARPAHPDWFRALRDNCADAGVAFMFKQWGTWAPVDLDRAEGVTDWFIVSRDGGYELPDYRTPNDDIGEVAMRRAGKEAAGNLLDGRQHLEFPA